MIEYDLGWQSCLPAEALAKAGSILLNLVNLVNYFISCLRPATADAHATYRWRWLPRHE